MFKHERTTDRLAIVGTAGTWKETPWDDPGVTIATLNDAYNLNFPRIDVQFEQHPLSSFVFRGPHDRTPVTPDQLPPGRYLRPEGYLEWLHRQSQSIPVLLQDDPPEGWTRAERYPREAIEEQYREVLYIHPNSETPYVSSGPSWMMLYALAMGYSEIQIYGIHLSTEREYRDQRPNFEGLITYAIAKGVKVVLPPGTPICTSESVYCYDPRMTQAEDVVRWDMHQRKAERNTVDKLLRTGPWHQRRAAKARKDWLDAKIMDLDQQLNRIMYASRVRRPEIRAAVKG